MRGVIGYAALVLLLVAGCSWSVGSRYLPPNWPYAEGRNAPAPAGNYSSLIEESRTLAPGDRLSLLMLIAEKPDLTSADREMLTEQSRTLPPADRVKLLRILAGGK